MAHKKVKAFGVEPSNRAYRLRLARYQALAEAIVEHVKSEPDQRQLTLLDVGVGNGRTFQYVEGVNNGIADRIRFVGADLSPRRLANFYAPDRWQLVRADAEKRLPFETGSFDIVVCEQVLEHLFQLETALAEMHRVLRPGGLAIIGVPIFAPPLHLFRNKLFEKIASKFGPKSDHVQTFTLNKIRKLVQKHFEVIDARGFRIISGGALSPLEDKRWWYEFNRKLGRALPWACVETQILARKPAQ